MRIRPLATEHKLSRQLFEQLAGEIRSGRLAPGDRLPTEHELTRAARVSRTVVREAVAALRAEGLVVTRQGVGAFVAPEPQHSPFRIGPERLHVVAVWEIMLLAAFLGTVNSIEIPTRQAFHVELVGKEDLQNAISLNSSVFNATRIIGPSIAGRRILVSIAA